MNTEVFNDCKLTPEDIQEILETYISETGEVKISPDGEMWLRESEASNWWYFGVVEEIAVSNQVIKEFFNIA